jgi:hypothetical protein
MKGEKKGKKKKKTGKKKKRENKRFEEEETREIEEEENWLCFRFFRSVVILSFAHRRERLCVAARHRPVRVVHFHLFLIVILVVSTIVKTVVVVAVRPHNPQMQVR